MHRFLSFVTIVFVFSRLLFPNYAPFIQDEPLLQQRVDRLFAEGHLPGLGLKGTQPIPYGPFPLWIYACVRLFGDSVAALILAQGILQITGLGFLFAALIRLFGKRWALPALLVVASSPYLFFYARLAWDNTFLYLFSSILIWLTVRILEFLWEGKDPARVWWIGLGLSIALCLGTHLMVIPFLGSVIGAVAVVRRRKVTVSGRLRFAFGSAFLACLLLLCPYLFSILTQISSLSGASPHGSLFLIPGILARMGELTTPANFVDYFLDRRQLQGSTILDISAVAAVFQWLWALTHVSMSAYVLFSVVSNRRDWSVLSVCIALGVLTVFSQAVFYAISGHYEHPHYFHYTQWFSCLIAGSLLYDPATRPLGRRVVGVLVALNLFFLCGVTSFLFRHGGTRAVQVGTLAIHQAAVVKSLCESTDAGRVELDISAVRIFPISLEYFFSREPACRNKALQISHSAPWRLTYADTPHGSAVLQVVRVGEASP